MALAAPQSALSNPDRSATPTKKSPRFYSGRSVACLCVEERLIFVIRGRGIRLCIQLVRTHAFFESLAF